MARQEKSLAVCLEILQDYTAKDFSLFAVLTTADFYSHNSQFHFLSHNPKTSVKFLFSFAALIFFPPHGLSFGHQPLSCRCKGMAAGFGNKRSSLRFSKKSPHRWVVFFPKNLVFPASPPLKSTWNETTDATGRRKKNVGKGSDKKVKKRELPFSSWNRK